MVQQNQKFLLKKTEPQDLIEKLKKPQNEYSKQLFQQDKKQHKENEANIKK